MDLILIFIAIIIFFFALLLLEKNKEYTEQDFHLIYYTCEDGSYYFGLGINFWQFKKELLAKELYSQGSHIFCDRDNSEHIVTRWGARKDGIQQIFAKPFIAELNEANNISNIVNIKNYGTITLNFIDKQIVSDLYEEIHNNYAFDSECEEVLTILKMLNNNQNPEKRSLEKLLDFLERYDPLSSMATNLISIILGVLSL